MLDLIKNMSQSKLRPFVNFDKETNPTEVKHKQFYHPHLTKSQMYV